MLRFPHVQTDPVCYCVPGAGMPCAVCRDRMRARSSSYVPEMAYAYQVPANEKRKFILGELKRMAEQRRQERDATKQVLPKVHDDTFRYALQAVVAAIETELNKDGTMSSWLKGFFHSMRRPDITRLTWKQFAVIDSYAGSLMPIRRSDMAILRSRVVDSA